MSNKRKLDSGALEIGNDVGRESARYEKSKMHKVEINNGTSLQETKDASTSCLCDDCANFDVTFSFNDEEIEGLRKVNTHDLLRHRKLNLVLNLDNTLLTCTKLSNLAPEEKYIKTQTADDPLPLQDVFKVQVPPEMKRMVIKLRPFARAFLKEASDMFEIYAYKNASRSLVWKMVELLDPRNDYFGRRVISREDYVSSFAGKKKCLDLVLAQEATVLILDHEQETWTEENQENIILTQKYQFFKKRSEQHSEFKSHCELKTDEGVYFEVILQHLKLIHSRFFDNLLMCDNLIDRDVRKVLKTLWGNVLQGCKIAFDPLQANMPRLWKMAEQLGDKCVEQLDPSITHVVAAHVGTLESRWAVEENKFLVHPSWIEASNCMWQKCQEDKFPVTEDISQQKMALQLATACDEQVDPAASEVVVAHVETPAKLVHCNAWTHQSVCALRVVKIFFMLLKIANIFAADLVIVHSGNENMGDINIRRVFIHLVQHQLIPFCCKNHNRQFLTFYVSENDKIRQQIERNTE